MSVVLSNTCFYVFLIFPSSLTQPVLQKLKKFQLSRNSAKYGYALLNGSFRFANSREAKESLIWLEFAYNRFFIII